SDAGHDISDGLGDEQTGAAGRDGRALGAEVDEPLVDPVIDELAELIVKVEEQMVALVMDMEEDLAMLFSDDDFSDDGLDDNEDDEEVWEMDKEWLMAPRHTTSDASYAPTEHL
ncbi:hypothetical protein Tco_0288507, partial [Tanacetum coccineum]